MLTLIKKFFGKAAPKAAAPTAPEVPLAPSTPMPSIEVAHLALGAITARFTDELKPLLVSEPGSAATVALPMPTILKQLPAGCVKMSLATLQRQSHGLIRPLPPGDKRMVDVPLAEIFRHVKLSALKRRLDQRPVMIPETGFNLFGDVRNPYAISPDDHLEQVSVVDLTPAAGESEEAEPAGPRLLKMDDGLRQHFANTPAARSGPAADSPSTLRFELSDSGARTTTATAAPADYGAPKVTAPIGKPEGPTLNFKLTTVCANWPEDVRQEIATLDPETLVSLPVEEIGAGLGRGRVIFSWGHIRAWMEPAPTAPTIAAENVALQLPLKIVAPAYLSASKAPKAERKTVDMDESIPALFNGGREPAPKPAPKPAPAAPAAPAPEAAEVPAQTEEPVQTEASVQAEAPIEVEAPIQVDAAGSTEAAPAPKASETPAAAPEPIVVVAAPPTAPEARKAPDTVGQIFGQPHKQDWTPAEIVAGAIKLPGVAGAIVALQEGLQVASSLPDGVKSDVVAAFLPQIFARLNQYSGEMKLGDVDDLLFTTHGAHCQIYRLGYVYLAVLGKPGESLPWHELRLISEEMARQTHK